jgi:hypothetical protein
MEDGEWLKLAVDRINDGSGLLAPLSRLVGDYLIVVQSWDINEHNQDIIASRVTKSTILLKELVSDQSRSWANWTALIATHSLCPTCPVEIWLQHPQQEKNSEQGGVACYIGVTCCEVGKQMKTYDGDGHISESDMLKITSYGAQHVFVTQRGSMTRRNIDYDLLGNANPTILITTGNRWNVNDINKVKFYIEKHKTCLSPTCTDDHSWDIWVEIYVNHNPLPKIQYRLSSAKNVSDIRRPFVSFYYYKDYALPKNWKLTIASEK